MLCPAGPNLLSVDDILFFTVLDHLCSGGLEAQGIFKMRGKRRHRRAEKREGEGGKEGRTGIGRKDLRRGKHKKTRTRSRGGLGDAKSLKA